MKDETTKSTLVYGFVLFLSAAIGIVFIAATWNMLDRAAAGQFSILSAVDRSDVSVAGNGRNPLKNVPAWFESIDSGYDAEDLSGYTVFCDVETGNVYLYQRGHSRISMTVMFDRDKPMTKERYLEIKEKYGGNE